MTEERLRVIRQRVETRVWISQKMQETPLSTLVPMEEGKKTAKGSGSEESTEPESFSEFLEKPLEMQAQSFRKLSRGDLIKQLESDARDSLELIRALESMQEEFYAMYTAILRLQREKEGYHGALEHYASDAAWLDTDQTIYRIGDHPCGPDCAIEALAGVPNDANPLST